MENEKINLAEYVEKFLMVYNADSNGRYLSYDHVRTAFLNYRKDETKRDLLSLNLYSYLASWGMLRNSFLMQKDYKFLAPIVDIICKERYEPIVNYNPFNDEGNQKPELIVDLVNEIRNYLLGKTYFEEGSNKLKKITNVSETLITKILLGTLGCTVAYDTYVKKGLSKHKLVQKIGMKSILQLRSLAKTNEEEIMKYLSRLNELYTPMKIIDMYFFEEGFTL